MTPISISSPSPPCKVSSPSRPEVAFRSHACHPGGDHRLPVPDDGHSRPCAGACSGTRRSATAGTAGFAGVDVHPGPFGGTCRAGATGAGLRCLEAIQRFVSGSGPFAFFDAPWTPVFPGVLFMFHWMLGVLVVFSGRLLFVLALLNQARTGHLQHEFAEATVRAGH